MKFFSGKDYPHLCEKCRNAINDIAAVFDLGCMEDTDDQEAPCNYVYDHKMFCGGHECVNRPDERNPQSGTQ